MRLVQNLKQKSIARKSMILLAAVTLSTVVATDALAAGHGGGAPAVAVESEGATLVAGLAVGTWVADLVAADSPVDMSAPDLRAAA